VTFPLQWIAGQAFNLLPAGVLLALVYLGSTNAERDASEGAAFDRRYVAWLALAPFLLTTLIGGALGRLIIAMWGYPLWSFAPLALLLWWKPVADGQALRRFAAAFIAVFVAVPVIYAAVEIGEPFVRDRGKATQFPGKALATVVTQAWHQRYGTPLTYVGGTEFAANNVAVYSPDRPHVVVHGELKLSPWIDKDALRQHGAVVVWEKALEGADLAELKATFGDDIDVQPTLVLPRQTWRPVRPDQVGYAFVPPRP
jgi:hypothetical protein